MSQQMYVAVSPDDGPVESFVLTRDDLIAGFRAAVAGDEAARSMIRRMVAEKFKDHHRVVQIRLIQDGETLLTM